MASPAAAPAVEEASLPGFLAALQDPACALAETRAWVGRVPGRWRTQPRVDAQYRVHYLFCAPTAALEILQEGRSRSVGAGTLCWFPPGVPYELFLHERRSQTLLRLRFQLWRDGRLVSPFRDAVLCPRAVFAQELFTRCSVEFASDAPETPYRSRCLLGLLATDVARGLGDPGGAGRLDAAQMDRLVAYAVARVSLRPTPADLADVLQLSPTHFARVFRRTTGVSARRWLVELRIRQAAEALLESRRPIHEVALEYGYDNPFLFSRQFSQVMGTSPRSYRRRSR